MGIAQTGPLASSGKAALVALRMGVEDVNARGGLLVRRVELIAYDDQDQTATEGRRIADDFRRDLGYAA